MANRQRLFGPRVKLVRLLAVVFVALFATRTAGAAEQPFRFDGWDGPAIDVRLFVPENATDNTRIVIVMHGASRDAARYHRDWVEQAQQQDFIVVTPEFDAERFRGSARYNLGHVFDPKTGRKRDSNRWTFAALEPLFDEVVSRVGGAQQDYVIFGHSAGAQFVHRFMYYMPEARASRFIAANAGWYTLPAHNINYPYGLHDSAIDTDAMARIFSSDLMLLLGKEDTDPNSSSLRKTAEAQLQGPHRLARGRTMAKFAQRQAEALGLEFTWRVGFVEGAGHKNAEMTPAAALLALQ